MPATIRTLGYELMIDGRRAATAWALDRISSKRPGGYVVCANPHSLVVAESDRDFQSALCDAELILPDGIGVAVAARLIHGRNVERITGSDFFSDLVNSAATERPIKFFFLGSAPPILREIEARLAKDNPSAIYAGGYSPPFVSEFSASDNEAMLKAIEDAAPDVLCVGMTAPKQEKWIHKNKSRLHVPVTCAIGAVFDYYAGTKLRPHWSSRLGLEWLVRFLQEPRRLWRRTFISGPKFVLLVLKDSVSRSSSKS